MEPSWATPAKVQAAVPQGGARMDQKAAGALVAAQFAAQQSALQRATKGHNGRAQV